MTDASATRYCALAGHTAAKVTGDDAAAFLQAQLVNDVQQLTPGRTQLSGWCNPKGRLLAVLRLFRDEAHWLLRLPTELAEPTLQRLRLFVLRSRVTIEPLGDQWLGLGLWGAGATETLRAAGLPAPATPEEVAWHQGVAVLHVPGDPRRFELWGPTGPVEAAAAALRQAGAGEAAPQDWELEEIRAGLPEIYAATREQFVPQTVNMDLVGALSFTKGCYPGQEIVARTKYLGRLKRRMFRLHAPQGRAAEPGLPVFRPARSPTDPAGTVVRAAPAGAGIELLASLRIEDAEAGGLTLGTPDGPALERLELPYAVTAEQG